MRPSIVSSLLLLTPVLSTLGCSPKTESNVPTNEPAAEAAPAPDTAASAPPAASVEPAPSAAPPAAALDPELEKLYQDLEQAHQAELARLTPEVRATTRSLAAAEYKSGREAITAALASPHRHPDHPPRDSQRHAVETLEFFGFAPGQRVLEYGPGGGWYTELLAPALARSGALSVTLTDPEGPREQRATYYAKRTQLFLERLPEAYEKVLIVTFDPKAPKLPIQGEVDLVLLVRGAHGMHNNGALRTWLTVFHEALAPNGVLGIVQHRAKPGAKVDESSKQGYLPEQFVIEQAVAAGFRFAGKSEINANPKDTTEHPEGVWTLPPTLRLGEQDRDKYTAIGESDRMTLKFVKPAGATPKQPAGAGAATPKQQPAGAATSAGAATPKQPAGAATSAGAATPKQPAGAATSAGAATTAGAATPKQPAGATTTQR